MNNRIAELAEQAGAKFSFGGFTNYDQFDYESFAKLIIKECAEVASDYDGASHVGTAVEKHFGVE